MSVIDEILNDFPTVSATEWKELFLKETKQSEWKADVSLLGFEYLPFYSGQVQNKQLQAQYAHLLPDYKNGWHINREIKVENENDANNKSIEALNEGISSVTFNNHRNSDIDFDTLLKNISYNDIEVNYRTNIDLLFVQKFIQNFNSNKSINGALYFDAIGNALLNGGWNTSFDADCNALIETHKILNRYSNLKYISIDAGIYHYSGGNYIQTLIWTLSHAIEYFNYFNSKGITADEIHKHFVIEWPVGLNFFADIAMLRTLRLLWNHILQFITGNTKKLYQLAIHAHTSINYWTMADKNTNMLRATSQAFAATAGGANSLTVYPFDYLTSQENSFSNRIASNVQLILREESFLSKVNDPSGGSGLVEQLTQQFFNKTLEGIKELENSGGLLENIKTGNLQAACEKNNLNLIEAFKTGKLKVLGLNLYADKSENVMKNEIINPFIKHLVKDEFKAMIKNRIVEKFEFILMSKH